MRLSAFGYDQLQMVVKEKTIIRTAPMHRRRRERLMKWLVLLHDFLKVSSLRTYKILFLNLKGLRSSPLPCRVPFPDSWQINHATF